MSEKDKGNLSVIIESCSKIRRFVDDAYDAEAFFADEKTFDAVLMNFVVIGEAVARLTDELKEKETRIPWARIKGFRNIVAHDYFGVDAEEVWQIVNNHLPDLEKEIKKIVKER